MSQLRHHVFVCTSGNPGHWPITTPPRTGPPPNEDEERANAATYSEHANGHIGARCGEHGSQALYEHFRERLAGRDIADVLLSATSCLSQHVAGPIVVVYPDGIWYGRVQPSDVDEIIDAHLTGGVPVERLIWREVDSAGCIAQ